MENSNKKILILQIYEILKNNSCQSKPITQAEIKRILEKEGLSCDRKTIARNIDYLIDYGYDIKKISGGGCFLEEDYFDDSEIIFLFDTIYSSPAITQDQAIKLIDKLTGKLGKQVKQKFNNIYKIDEVTRTDNKQIFYNIEQINYAINHGNKICFIYNKYGIDKKLVPRKQEKYLVNPYFMLNSKGKYFLVCNKENRLDLANYRIDYMTNIDVLKNSSILPISQTLFNKDGFSRAQYAQEHIYMFSGPSVNAKLKLSSEKIISDIIDWFGQNVEFSVENDVIYANVTANEKALVCWCLQYGRDVEIVSPFQTRELLKIELKKIASKYNDDEY